jgi:hypothetical protein
MKKMIKSIIVLLIVILSISLVSASEVLNLKFDVNDDGTLNFLSSEVSGYEYIEGNAIFGAIDINDIDQGDITYSGDLFYDQGNLALFLGNANWQDKDYDSACYINLVNSNIECLYVEGGKVGNEINVNKLTQEANGFNTMKVLNFEQVKMDLENVEDEFDVLQDNSLITKLYIEGEMIDNEIFVGDLSIQNLDITDGNYFGICFVGNEADCYVTLKEEFVPEPIVSLSSLFCDYLDCGELLNVKLDENGENLDFISMEESVGSSVEGDLSLNLISEDEVKGNILFSGNWILNSNGNEYFYGDSDVVYDGNEYDDVLTFCIINYPNLDCGFSLEEGENSGVLVASLEHIGSGLD